MTPGIVKLQEFVNFKTEPGFTTAGAFVRWPDGRVTLWKGPWRAVEAKEADVGLHEYYGGHTSWLKAADSLEATADEWAEAAAAWAGPLSFSKSSFSTPVARDFEDSFRAIQGKIQREEIVKAVPFTTVSAPVAPTAGDRLRFIDRVIALPGNLNAFGYWNEGRGVLGATPEVLFDLNGTSLTTMALAGTLPKSEVNERAPLLRDPKEMKEHAWVADDIEKILKGVGWLKREPTRVLELPTLFHLMTEFSVEGCTRSPDEILRLMHPTPALGVAPRAYGYQWMKDLPGQDDRGIYGAPVTFRRGEHTRALVAIRSLFWDGSLTRVRAGSGIVAESQLEREWAEVGTKLQSVFTMLGL